MTSLASLNRFTKDLKFQGAVMPLLFVGHGSPTNGIEDNEYVQAWKQQAKDIPVPTAVLVISAHWLTKGTKITAMDFPPTIHDFGGFPKALYEVVYPAPGDPKLAAETAALVKKTHVDLDHEWGLDHGAWTVIRHMYPEANIPVLQLSIDYNKDARYHYELAAELAELRKKGVLIMGSGNMVHNLRMIGLKTGSVEDFGLEYGYDWAKEINEVFKKNILEHQHEKLIHYEQLGTAAQMAIPTPDHYYPLMYVLGLQGDDEDVTLFNDKLVAGSISMTGVKIAKG